MQHTASSGQGLINRSTADCVGNYSDPWGVRTNLLLVVEDTPWSRAPSNLPYNDKIGNYSVLDYEFIDTSWQASVIRWVCGDWEDDNTWDGLHHWTRLNHTVIKTSLPFRLLRPLWGWLSPFGLLSPLPFMVHTISSTFAAQTIMILENVTQYLPSLSITTTHGTSKH